MGSEKRLTTNSQSPASPFLTCWALVNPIHACNVPEGACTLVDPGLLTGSRERALDHDDQGTLMMAVHLWLRAETKPNERRTHITPERCKDLVKAGKAADKKNYCRQQNVRDEYPVCMAVFYSCCEVFFNLSKCI